MILKEDFRLPREFVATYKERLAAEVPDIVEPRKSGETNPYDIPWSLDDGTFDWVGFDAATRISNVYQYLHIPSGSLEGNLVLDAGCGNGALSVAIAQEGSEVVAFDYSGVVERAAMNRKFTRNNGNGGKVHYLQADVQAPPFAEQAFNIVYSDGVIHLAEDPREAFHALARLLKPHGRIFVSVSRRPVGSQERARRVAVDFLQKGFRKIPIKLSMPICLVGAAIRRMHGYVWGLLGRQTRSLGSLRHEAIMLWNVIALPRHRYYDPPDVATWFIEEGFSDIQESRVSHGRTGFGILGVRHTS